MTEPVRVGIVDSGVHVHHPHVGGIAGGVTVEADACHPGYTDYLGHGTAIAALIHALAPSAQLMAVRIFDRTLTTSIHRVIRAIDWCLQNGVRIVNLSLGTVNPDHRAVFAAAVERVANAGAVLVSAYEMNGQTMLPGCMPRVIAVVADPACPRDQYRCVERGGKQVFIASPFPLDIPGVRREHNLNGVSFAVAHISAHLARRRPSYKDGTGWEQILAGGASLLESA